MRCIAPKSRKYGYPKVAPWATCLHHCTHIWGLGISIWKVIIIALPWVFFFILDIGFNLYTAPYILCHNFLPLQCATFSCHKFLPLNTVYHFYLILFRQQYICMTSVRWNSSTTTSYPMIKSPHEQQIFNIWELWCDLPVYVKNLFKFMSNLF